MRRSLRWMARGAMALAFVVAAIAIIGWLALRGSLPRLDGELALAGLSAAVTIERDADGVATVTAANRLDVSRALGYLHAQERYFEMDLTRRSAAGELAELFGAAAVAVDRRHRVHRFRARVQRYWAALPAGEREQMQAYADGVNAGLADLRVRPWPYLLLRETPQPWRGEDGLLVVLAMFFDLQDEDNSRERKLDFARRWLAPAAFDFIVRDGTPWDAPLTGTAVPEPPMPSSSDIDLRTLPAVPAEDDGPDGEENVPGSNSFAVAGRLTAHGHAIVADDMHLGLRVPNIWFRARLVHGEGAARVDVQGVTLPGVPAVVVGSNGRIAWAFTNSYGDWLDLVRLQVAPDDAGDGPDRYRTRSGWRSFDDVDERIVVAGADDETVTIRETLWGPVIGEDADGHPLALAWTAHRDGAVNTELLALETARDVDDAIAAASRAGVPAQNFIVGDASGRIAWTIAGRIPVRLPGLDGSRPVDGSTLDGDLWTGWLAPETAPKIIDPTSGRLWTANARVVDGDRLAIIGDGGYDNGARAAQIRDGLLAKATFAEADLLAVQLDDRAVFMQRWWLLLREVLAGAGADDDALSSLATATQDWDGCACVDSVSYRLARAFRTEVHDTVMRGLSAPLRVEDAEFSWPKLGQNEGVVWQLLRERPAHLLPPPHDSWDGLLAAAARRVVVDLGAETGGLAARTWGEANTVRVRHPLSAALPGFMSRWLDMSPQALPGDSHMPRVQGVEFGASQRMVVAPGRESNGLMHMPGGQSGNPLSPHYGAGHDDWAGGRATSLSPAATRSSLRLVPRGSTD